MPHMVTTSSKRLLALAKTVPFFAGDELAVEFRPGHGYYLSRNGQHFAWFRYEKVGTHWLNDLKRTGQPNFANLRNGTAYQRGEFQNAPECPSESVQNVTPVSIRLVCTQSGTEAQESPTNGHSSTPRRDGHFIRWGMHKPKYPLHRDRALLKLVSGILLYRLGKRHAPGMTVKGVKWSFEQEDQEVRA